MTTVRLAAILPIIAWALCACSHTPAASTRPLRVALISDTHMTRGTNEDQALHPGRFDKAIAAVNRAEVDLVLVAGDLTEKGTKQELEDFKNRIQQFEAPVWYVPGNHDVGSKVVPGKKSDSITSERLATYEAVVGPSYFAREVPGLRVVAINGSLLGSGLPEESQQWEFLEKELGRASSTPRIALVHYPLYVIKPAEPGGEYWNVEPGPRQRLLTLLEQGQVKAVLSGHLHRRIVSWQKNTLYLTSSPVSFALPRGKEPRGWTLLAVPREGQIRQRFQRLSD